MSWRTVIIENRAKLDYKMGYLVVRSEEHHRILIDEIAVLVLENPAISLTGCLLEALIEKKVKVIFCDSKRSPIDYFELVTEYDKRKVFVLVGLRSYLDDVEMEAFTDTICRKGYLVTLIESVEHIAIKGLNRYIVDKDLCEIG